METLSALLALCRPVNSPDKGRWRGALRFLLICVWTKGCESNRGAGDLRRHRGHYVTKMFYMYIVLLIRLFMHRSKKTPKLLVTGVCEGSSPVASEFPAQRPVTRQMFPFDDVIMFIKQHISTHYDFNTLIERKVAMNDISKYYSLSEM